MRLAIVDSGHGFRTKALFAFIRAVSRLPVPDAVKLNRYRPDFYGMPMGAITQEAMRGRSAWSVDDRELMGASVSKINECECCTKVHAAVAALAYRDAEKVSTALSDLETAVIGEPLRATVRMLRKLTREHSVDADDMRAVLAAGVSREQIEDALAVSLRSHDGEDHPSPLRSAGLLSSMNGAQIFETAIIVPMWDGRATGIAVTGLYDLSGTWVDVIVQIDPMPGFWDKFLI
jgi:AhpD family alkylhydroperoxidase